MTSHSTHVAAGHFARQLRDRSGSDADFVVAGNLDDELHAARPRTPDDTAERATGRLAPGHRVGLGPPPGRMRGAKARPMARARGSRRRPGRRCGARWRCRRCQPAEREDRAAARRRQLGEALPAERHRVGMARRRRDRRERHEVGADARGVGELRFVVARDGEPASARNWPCVERSRDARRNVHAVKAVSSASSPIAVDQQRRAVTRADRVRIARDDAISSRRPGRLAELDQPDAGDARALDAIEQSDRSRSTRAAA